LTRDPSFLAQASLLAGAMGDSLGAEIEFWPLDRIAHQFPNGLRDLPPHQGIVGAITDDTQMTLFTAEGLIRAWVRGRLRGIGTFDGPVHHALLRWLRTQGVEANVTEADHVALWKTPGFITAGRRAIHVCPVYEPLGILASQPAMTARDAGQS